MFAANARVRCGFPTLFLQTSLYPLSSQWFKRWKSVEIFSVLTFKNRTLSRHFICNIHHLCFHKILNSTHLHSPLALHWLKYYRAESYSKWDKLYISTHKKKLDKTPISEAYLRLYICVSYYSSMFLNSYFFITFVFWLFLGYFGYFVLIWANFGVTSVYFGLLFLTAFLGCRRSFLVLLYLF